MAEPYQLSYKPPGPVAASFLQSEAFVRGILGPIGSGKSVSCAIELFRRASQQAPAKDKVRYTRHAVVRNTNPELRSTTIKTWLEWFPEQQFGKFRWSVPYTHHIRLPLGDDTAIDCEMIFLALDRPEDIKKLLSLEVTSVWINEAREVHKEVVDAATGRVGRYPSKRKGGPTWAGVVMDTNAPSEDHWWPIMAGDREPPDWLTDEDRLTLIRPPDWEFFTQPPAMTRLLDGNNRLAGYELNQAAENIQHLPKGYYDKALQGKKAAWINVYVLSQYGKIVDGRPVYDGWRREMHVALEPLAARKDTVLEIGLDFGLTPAAIVTQRWGQQIVVLAELVGRDIGAVRFARRLKTWLAANFADHYPDRVRLWGDPAGDARSQVDERTATDIYRAEGFTIRPAPTNDPVLRVEAVNRPLGALYDGKPGLLVNPGCATLISGFEGGYRYAPRAGAGFEKEYQDVPEKNQFSHPHDALQYACVGMGEARAVLGRHGAAKPVIAARTGDPFSRREARRRPLGSSLRRAM